MRRLSLSAFIAPLVAVAVFGARPAEAYCRSQVTPTMGTCDQTCSGRDLVYWNSRHFKWTLYKDPTNSTIQSDLAWDDVQAALNRSVTTWQNVACTDLSFEYTGPSSDFKTGFDSKECATDNQNVVVFREKTCSEAGVVPAGDDCVSKGTCGQKYNCWKYGQTMTAPIAVTSTLFDKTTGEIVDADMEFDATLDTNGKPVQHFTINDSTTVCNPVNDLTQTGCAAIDVENTATHEFGHFLGLAHPDYVDSTAHPEATMFSHAPPGELSKRDLAQDDIDGICAIYPKGQQTAWCKAPAAAPNCDDTTVMNKPCGFCSGTGGVDILAFMMLAEALRRRRFHRKNL